MHSELPMDEVAVMLASDDSDYVVAPLVGRSTGAGLYVVVDDVDLVYAAAVNAGDASVFPPEDTDMTKEESGPRALSPMRTVKQPARRLIA
ncbi:hypothetical protein [Arthrobacter sp. 92]|uniref:hypothetical protein n=1 Tax=Arthrobacter sp. 92 TaxID=3418175 RepID=UPI003CFC42B8